VRTAVWRMLRVALSKCKTNIKDIFKEIKNSNCLNKYSQFYLIKMYRLKPNNVLEQIRRIRFRESMKILHC
jgi:hypothetical protein